MLVDHIELYRQTVAAVGEEALAAMTPAARERAFQRELRTMGYLHVAHRTPEGHYKVLPPVIAKPAHHSPPFYRNDLFPQAWNVPQAGYALTSASLLMRSI